MDCTPTFYHPMHTCTPAGVLCPPMCTATQQGYPYLFPSQVHILLSMPFGYARLDFQINPPRLCHVTDQNPIIDRLSQQFSSAYFWTQCAKNMPRMLTWTILYNLI